MGIGSAMAGAVAMGLALAASAAAGERHALVVAGGEAAGAFLPEAGAICRLVNKERPGQDGTCLIEPTAGSAANIGLLRDGALQIAIVQSKIAADARAGQGVFAKAGPYSGLRALFSLHGEAVMVMVNPEATIKTAADLKGKRVNLGRRGGFQRLMAEALLSAEGLAPSDLAAALEMDSAQQVRALCSNQIDAAFFSGIHPMAEVEAAIDQCGAAPLPLDDAALGAYLEKTPWLARLEVAAGVYQGVDLTVPTFGPRALAVTTDALPEADAYAVVKAVFDNHAAFRAMYPLLSDLDRRQMAEEALSIPLHEGAKRYFRENRLP